MAVASRCTPPQGVGGLGGGGEEGLGSLEATGGSGFRDGSLDATGGSGLGGDADDPKLPGSILPPGSVPPGSSSVLAASAD